MQSIKTSEQKANDKAVNQTHQIFNIAEKPMIDFISQFLEEPVSVLFTEELPSFTEPLILMPLEDYKENVYVKFSIIPIPSEQIKSDDDIQRVNNIKSMIKHERVREGIGFLYYCIKHVYASLISVAMINNNQLLNLKVKLDENNWVFYLEFYHELTHQKEFYKEVLQTTLQAREQYDNLDEEKKQLLNNEFTKSVTKLKEIETQITPKIKQEEIDTNKLYKTRVKLGIFIEDLDEKDLPKKPELPKNKNMLSNLPSISESLYKRA
jgi:hypothetical protein